MPSKAERQTLRLYVRLAMSYADFKHAYRAAERLIHEHDSMPNLDGDDLVLRAIYSSLVVAYARPFNSSGSSRIGRIPALDSEVLVLYSRDEREVHEYVLYCRNKLIAHTDAEASDPDVFVASDRAQGVVISQTNDALAPFTREYAAEVRGIAEKAYRWSVEERRRLEPSVLHLLERRAMIPKGPTSAPST